MTRATVADKRLSRIENEFYQTWIGKGEGEMKKRYLFLGCFKIRETKEVCCEKRANEPFSRDRYYGKGKTGHYPPQEEENEIRDEEADENRDESYNFMMRFINSFPRKGLERRKGR